KKRAGTTPEIENSASLLVLSYRRATPTPAINRRLASGRDGAVVMYAVMTSHVLRGWRRVNPDQRTSRAAHERIKLGAAVEMIGRTQQHVWVRRTTVRTAVWIHP